MQSDNDHAGPVPKPVVGSSAANGAVPQSRIWLDVDFEELDQFTSPTIVCQYCFRPIGLDRSLELLVAELRRKPMILATTPLEPLWATEIPTIETQPSSASTSYRQLPTAYPSRLRTPHKSQLSTPRTFNEEDTLQGDTSARFAAALPATPTTPSIPPTPIMTRSVDSRKNFVNVTPPAMMLQPRRPKERAILAPHEPHPVEPLSPATGGSLRHHRRHTSISSRNTPNSPLVSSAKIERTSSTASLSDIANVASKPRPSLTDMDFFTQDEKDDEVSTNSSSAPQTMTDETTDEQLFRELIAHTIAEYDLDVPLCCECAPMYHELLLVELEDMNTEIEEVELQLALFPPNETLKTCADRFELEIQSLTESYETLEKEFDELVVHFGKTQERNRIYDRRMRELQTLKDDYWSRYTRFKHEDMCQNDFLGTMKTRLADKSTHLEMLRTSCGLNDIFSIGFNGHYATINGLRLGLRSPTLKSAVDWDEVSAAFGFLLFLFGKLGAALSHNWQAGTYRIRLDGSFSGLYQTSKGESYNLYLDKDSWSLLRFRGQSAFDRGFEAFILCIIEVSSIIFTKDPEFFLPYTLTKSPLTIGGHELVSSRSFPEKWTHLSKLLATNIKTILKWLVSRGLVK